MTHSIVRQLKLNLRYAFGLYPSSSALSSLMSNAAEAPSVFVGVDMCAEGGSVFVCVCVRVCVWRESVVDVVVRVWQK